jgi:hypothetical protein
VQSFEFSQSLEQQMRSSLSGSLSSVPNAKIIDFECAELRRVPLQDSLYLWVRGIVPGPGIEVKLAPRYHYSRPDYWDIEVAAMAQAGAANDDGENSIGMEFERSVPLTGITGFRGISVIGANKVTRIDISEESF